MQTLVTIDTLQGIKELESYLSDKQVVAFDTETTGLTREAQIIGFSICAEPGKAYYVIAKYWKHGMMVELDTSSLAPVLIKSLVGKKLIMHNSVFDCSMVSLNYNIDLMSSVYVDTMILAHLLDENRKIALKELGKHYFGEDAGEEQRLMKESIIQNEGTATKKSYELYKADPALIAKYGAKDALLTYNIYNILMKDLEKQGLTDFFFEESMPLLRGPTYQLNTSGLKIDKNKLISLKKSLEVDIFNNRNFIYKEINEHIKERYPGTNKKNTFNIQSPSQLSWLLFGKIGLEFGLLTKEGKELCKHFNMKLPYTYKARQEFIDQCNKGLGITYNGHKKIKEPWAYMSTDKNTLDAHSSRYDWIKSYLEMQRSEKLLSTYVIGIESRIQYGIIYPSFLQTGTTSGRYSSRNPNFQNLPKSDKRVKEIIVSRPGKVFVGADYSQLEARVFAYVSNDKNLLAAFKTGEDFYSVIGQAIYNKYDCHTKKDGTPESFAVKYESYRQQAKVLALASVYGASARQLAPGLKKSIDDTELDIESYMNRFPGVKNMILLAHKNAKQTGRALNIFGRPRRIPEAMSISRLYKNKSHAGLPYAARTLLNLATNHRIQSTAASIVNRAAIQFYQLCKDANIEAPIVLQVHDSLVIECNEKDADDVKELLRHAMEKTIELASVSLEAEPNIGKNLSEV